MRIQVEVTTFDRSKDKERVPTAIKLSENSKRWKMTKLNEMKT